MKLVHILFPVDFSERCTAAAGRVAAMAEHFNAKVTILHAMQLSRTSYNELAAEAFPELVDMEQLKRDRQGALDGYLRSERALGPASRVLVEGDPAHEIVEVARHHQVDLIMMPTHGRGPFRRFLLGSVTAKVLHDAVCPVWTDVHAVSSYSQPGCRLVLCAVDLRKDSVPSIQWAAEYAASYGTQLLLVHVIPGYGNLESPAEAEARRYLVPEVQKHIADLQWEAGTGGRVCILSGKIAQEIRHAAVEHGADLIVPGQGSMHEAMGRVRTNSYSIIREAPCPVMRV